MPYTARFTFVPEPGFASEVRDAVAERARAFHTTGKRATSWITVSGRDFQASSGFLVFDSLDEMAEIQIGAEAEANDVMNEKMKGKLRNSYSILFDGLTQPSGPPPTGPNIFVQVVTRTPLPGKSRQLQELCIEQVQTLQGQGQNAGGRVQLAGPNDAAACETVRLFGSLDEWGKARAANRESGSVQKMLEKFGAATAETRIEVGANVVPPPRTS